MEEKVEFSSGTVRLVGLFSQNSGDKGVVVTHPHTLFGGSMHNEVVETIVRVYAGKGYSTFRFNFRGAGGSQGRFDNGRGETEDLRAAVSYLQNQGIREVSLSGYSFGTWVAGMAFGSCDGIWDMTMVAPPVGFMDFSPLASIECLRLVVSGDSDEFAPVGKFRTPYLSDLVFSKMLG